MDSCELSVVVVASGQSLHGHESYDVYCIIKHVYKALKRIT